MGYSDLARASEFFNVLMGKGGRYAAQQMLAPGMEGVRDASSGLFSGAGYLARSGQGVNLMAAAKQQEHQIVAGAYTGVQGAAAQQVGSIGQSAIGQSIPFGQAAIQTTAGVQNVLAQERIGEASFYLDRDKFNAQMDLMAQSGSMEAEIAIFGIEEQTKAAMAGLGASYARLAEDTRRWNQEFAFRQEESEYNRAWNEQQMDQQNQGMKWQTFGQALGVIGMALIARSSIQVKADVDAPTPPKEALQHVVQAADTLRSYRYQAGADRIPNGLILELAPRYAMANGTYLSIQTALGDLMASVKVLSEENTALRARLAQIEKEVSHG